MEEKQMAKRYEIQCPFFNGREDSHAGKKLFCESPVPGSSLTLFFQRKEDYRKQIQIFCCEHYKKCEIYRMVMAGYED